MADVLVEPRRLEADRGVGLLAEVEDDLAEAEQVEVPVEVEVPGKFCYPVFM